MPVVNFASEAGLAVLVALRYLPGDPPLAPDDSVLGWTDIDATPERVEAHVATVPACRKCSSLAMGAW